MTNTALIMIPINIPPIHEIAPFDDDDATVAVYFKVYIKLPIIVEEVLEQISCNPANKNIF